MREPDFVGGNRLRLRAVHLLVGVKCFPGGGGSTMVITIHPEHLTHGKQRADVFLPVQALLRAVVADGPLEPEDRLPQAIAGKRTSPRLNSVSMYLPLA